MGSFSGQFKGIEPIIIHPLSTVKSGVIFQQGGWIGSWTKNGAICRNPFKKKPSCNEAERRKDAVIFSISHRI